MCRLSSKWEVLTNISTVCSSCWRWKCLRQRGTLWANWYIKALQRRITGPPQTSQPSTPQSWTANRERRRTKMRFSAFCNARFECVQISRWHYCQRQSLESSETRWQHCFFDNNWTREKLRELEHRNQYIIVNADAQLRDTAQWRSHREETAGKLFAPNNGYEPRCTRCSGRKT